MEGTRSCLVCTAPITVTELGIEACRACAAFFKRTTLAGRTYTCRQGDGQCSFRKHEKFTCRSCRYDRCIELGMTYVAPPKRKPRKKVDKMQPSTSSSSTTSSGESILDRMEEEYRRVISLDASFDRRLLQEKHYAAVYNLKRISHPTEELYISSISSFYEVFRVTIKESIVVLQNVFEEFENVEIFHRATLFKNFLGKFSMVEAVYYSWKYFQTDFNFMVSLITCIDANNVEQWVTDEDNVERKDDLRTSIKSFARDYSDLLLPMLKMDELTEREFHSLIALAYCDLDPSLPLPDEILENAERTKTKIFEELQEYYRTQLKLADFSKRLGNLMTIAHGAGEAGNLMSEEMRMYATMFGVYSDDQLLREIFLE